MRTKNPLALVSLAVLIAALVFFTMPGQSSIILADSKVEPAPVVVEPPEPYVYVEEISYAISPEAPGSDLPAKEVVQIASLETVEEAVQEVVILDEGGPIRGIDLSKWQRQDPPIDWQVVKDSGIEFVIIKATEGTNYVDPSFADHWAGAKRAGLLVSAYHMLWGNLSASEQAQHFLDTLGDREPDFPLSLDVELRKGAGNIGAVVEEVLLALEAGDGRRPIVYTAQSVWGEIVGWAPGWKDYYLWVADYDAASPAMPTGWDSYHFHQHSSTGSVPGIRGNVDLNEFVGSREALMALGR